MKRCVGDRLACADLPAFSLQLLFRRHPEWHRLPVAVVSRETPQGEVLIASLKARQAGVFPGLTCAAAMGLAPALRVQAVSQSEIDEAKERVVEALRSFSPKVEADGGHSGAFWLYGGGLGRLYASPRAWGDEIRKALEGMGFQVVVVVGFSRFGTLALALGGRPGTRVFKRAEEELSAAKKVPLERLALPLWVTAELVKLGKCTVGDLLHMPADGLLDRYGPSVARLRGLAAGELWDPVVPVDHEEPPSVRLVLDDPESNALRLTFFIKGLLPPLLSEIGGRRAALAELEIRFILEGGEPVVERLRPARATLDERQLVDLVRLRLEHSPLEGGVVEIVLSGKTVPVAGRQLSLFGVGPRRDLDAANRAFARLRAQFGPEAVVQVKLRPGHLPEARFSFEPLERAVFPAPRSPWTPMLVRRVFRRPLLLTAQPGWAAGATQMLWGPYILSGGWWHQEIHREYYFAQNKAGKIRWVYWDKRRGGWYVQGEIE